MIVSTNYVDIQMHSNVSDVGVRRKVNENLERKKNYEYILKTHKNMENTLRVHILGPPNSSLNGCA